MFKIDIIAGARPNFMKIAPIIEAIKVHGGNIIVFRLVHTGQHFDKNMSQSFFEELGIPEPDVNLGAGGGTQAEQTATIMIQYEQLLLKGKTDLCLVVGDVTSSMACAIVAKKMQIKVAHVEGGIRSFDLTMPEEINRIVTDSITDYFYTTSSFANKNLEEAGISNERIIFVGNTMIDTLYKNLSRLKRPSFYDEFSLVEKSYFVLTLHRPANVDTPEILRQLLEETMDASREMPVIFPVHPRTLKILDKIKLNGDNIKFVPPLGYLEFNYLVKYAKGVITDSGGITEETTALGIPCLTLRDNTERPETITIGTNELVGTNPKNIAPVLEKLLNGLWKTGEIPQLWDGHTSVRIVEHLKTIAQLK